MLNAAITTHLRNCTPKLPPQPASCTPLAFHRLAHPWLFLRLQLLHTIFASLIVLFLPFSVSVVLCLLVYRVFLRLSSLETIHANFSVGGAFLYSGFNFSHSDLPFPTRCCIPYVRSGDLVCINLPFASRDFVCSRMTSIGIRFCPSAWTPRFQSRVVYR